MALTGPFLDRAQQFEKVKGFQLNRIVDFLNTYTSYGGAFYLPTSASGTVPTSSFGTIPLKFDHQTPSGVATITITPPTGFSHIEIKGQARSSAAATGVQLYIQFNGDTAADYVFQQLLGNNNAASSQQGTVATAQPAITDIVGDTATAGVGSPFTIEIMNYSGTTFIKEAMGRMQRYDLFAAANEFLAIRAVRWNNTAAITSITLGLASGNFKTGSLITAYAYP